MLPLRDESRHTQIPRSAQGQVDTSPTESVRLAAMDDLAELHRFNAWANRGLLAGVRQLSPEQLDEQQDGMYRTILGVLRHLAQVEFAYLSLMRSQSLDRGEFTAPWGLDQVEDVLWKTGPGLVEVARSATPDATFHIPWFQRDFTILQGLGQVLTHSINHRADVNQWLPRFGVDSTDQDYIDLVFSES
jgi:uncharacterized damage-inducible protein DinB